MSYQTAAQVISDETAQRPNQGDAADRGARLRFALPVSAIVSICSVACTSGSRQLILCFVRFMSDQRDQPRRNPLEPLAVAALVAAYFDARFYFFEHYLPAFGVPILASIAVFVGLFLLRSRFAWHAAGISLAGILPVAMLLTYYSGHMGFTLTWPLAVVDLLIYAIVAVYLWKKREPYFLYIAPKEI